jgi:hypothetical protein
MSRDGWLVTIDKLIVRAGPQVQSQVPDRFGYGGYSMTQPAIFNAKESGVQIYTPEIPPGPAIVAATYNQYSLYIGPNYEPYEDYADVMGSVTPADVARFREVSDQGFDQSDYGYVNGQGPSILLELHASKDGREVKLKVAVSTVYSSLFIYDDDDNNDGEPKKSENDKDPNNPSTGDTTEENEENDKNTEPPPVTKAPTLRGGITIEIRANALALARLEIAPERAFTTVGTDGIDIGRLLNTDPNNDGEVTGAELMTVKVATKEVRSSITGRDPTLLDVLAEKVSKHLLSARPL